MSLIAPIRDHGIAVPKFTEAPLMRTESLVSLVLCFACLAGGCSKPSASSPDLILQPQELSADHEIYDVALLDMISNKEFDPAVGGRTVNKSQVVLQDMTWGALSDHFLSHSLGDKATAISSEIRAELLRRNPKGRRYSLASFHPSSPSILVRDLSGVDIDWDFAEAFPDARGYVQAFLPGYSRDGRLALFYFHFGPTPHGAVGCYLISRETATWKIVWSSFNHFN
jgi:hypothetical protein